MNSHIDEFQAVMTLVKGSLDEAKRLVDGLADINTILVPQDGYNALHLAANSGSVDKLGLVLKRGPDLEVRSRNQRFTPLHTAVINNHATAAAVLLDAGANIEATANDGLTAIHLAAMRGHASVVRLLVQRGANVRATEANGATALHAAAFYGHTEVVRTLIEGGADPNAKDRHSFTPLLLAKQKGHGEALALMSNKPEGKGGVYASR